MGIETLKRNTPNLSTITYPDLIGYMRILKLMESALIPFCSYLTYQKAKPANITFVYFTKL
ncbi:hypothetical protein BTN49_3063 [Candidatus Enterovibrio escicola]|uniref:Mobile element protein n=1 Tax=Candidatus Enterovibrio escicola TaxID=1927127 RepID=A0A2A5T035_9GAMM|nr:hypothetical protein BTN49_3063 [Candidatus Enterovibrio escacola]